MLVYLDSKDLISLLDGSTSVRAEEFIVELQTGSHHLVVSFPSIIEIAGPLLSKHARSNVMRLLAQLEEMPLRFLNEARLDLLELREVVDAFSAGREPRTVNPFVNRFDECIPVEGPLLSRLYLRYGLAETVFDLWTKDPSIFGAYRRYGERLIQLLEANRALVNPPTLKKNFIKKIRDDLRLYGIPEPAAGIVPLARWIYAVPLRCPGNRLRYEVYHQIRRNKAAKVKPSHMVDLIRISALPYVDIMTMDGQMMAYTSQVIRKLALNYEGHIFFDLKAAFSRLCGREHPS